MIDSVFLERLVGTGLYGDPVDGLSASLKARAPDGLTEDTLIEAAERIINRHKPGSFPTLPTCRDAILAAHERRGKRPAQSTGSITRETYADRAASFCRGNPIVISRSQDPAAWDAWAGYFASLGMDFSARSMREATCETWTVPARFPQDFDPVASIADGRAPRKPASSLDDAVADVKRETDRECLERGIPFDSPERRKVFIEVLAALYPGTVRSPLIARATRAYLDAAE